MNTNKKLQRTRECFWVAGWMCGWMSGIFLSRNSFVGLVVILVASLVVYVSIALILDSIHGD